MRETMKHHTSILLGLALLLPASLTAQPGFSAPPSNTRMVRLDNGLHLLMIRLPGVPLVGLSAQVEVGSNMESEATSGCCHMLEHLLFNGTTSMSQEELYAAVDRMGGYNNAHTTNWYTNYMMLVPPESLGEGMEIQSSMLYRSTLPAEKFEKERGIVLEEIAQGRDRESVYDRMQAEWHDFLLEGSAQELPTLGTPATLGRLTRDEVLGFYQSWYRPNLTMLTVMGPIEFDDCLAKVEASYGQAAPGPRPDVIPRPAVLPLGQHRVRRLPVEQARLMLAWPAPALGEEGVLASTALTALLDPDGPALLSVGLFMQGLPPLPGLEISCSNEPGAAHFSVAANLPEGFTAEELEHGLVAALRSLASLEIPASKLEEWRLSQRTAEALLMEKPHYFGMSHAAEIVHTGFDGVLDLQARLKAIRPEDLAQLAGRCFAPAPAALLILPEGTSVGAVSTGHDALRVLTQPSGLTLIADSTGESDIFALQLMIMHRSAWEGPQRAGAIDLLHRLWADSPKARELARLGAQLKFHDAEYIPYDDHYTSPAWSFVRMEVLADEAATACELLVELMRDTPLEMDAFQDLRQAALRRAASKDGSASERARQLLDHALLGDSPSALPPEGDSQSLSLIKLSDLETLRSVILDPGNLVFSTRGPVGAGQLDSLFQSLLPPQAEATAALEALQAINQGLQRNPERTGFVPLSAKAPLTAADSTLRSQLGSAQSAIRMGSVFSHRPEDAAALRVLFSIISDRMAFDLRETRGWAYSLGAWASSRKGVAQAGATIGTRPENREEALRAMNEYLHNVKLKNLSEDEVTRTVSSLIGRERMRRMSSINQAWYRALDVISGDQDRTAKEDTELLAVRPEDVLRVARETLPTLHWITVIVE